MTEVWGMSRSLDFALKGFFSYGGTARFTLACNCSYKNEIIHAQRRREFKECARVKKRTRECVLSTSWKPRMETRFRLSTIV